VWSKLDARESHGGAGQNPNRDVDGGANDDEFDDDVVFDPSYSDDTEDNYYLQGHHSRGPARTGYGYNLRFAVLSCFNRGGISAHGNALRSVK